MRGIVLISKSFLRYFLILGFFYQASLATNIEEIEKVTPPQRILNSNNLGSLKEIPVDVWRTFVNPYLPLNKNVGSEGQSILNVSASFYYLVTGYWPEERGVIHSPRFVINHPVSWEIRDPIGCSFFKNYTPQTVPPFLWFYLLKDAPYLPESFWPYLKNTKVHKIDLEGAVNASKAVKLVQNLQGTKVQNVILASSYFEDNGILSFVENLPGTEVDTLGLWDNQITSEGILKIATALKKTKVHTINVIDNMIDDNTKDILRNCFSDIKWTLDGENN